jgi:hypothetical protein
MTLSRLKFSQYLSAVCLSLMLIYFHQAPNFESSKHLDFEIVASKDGSSRLGQFSVQPNFFGRIESPKTWEIVKSAKEIKLIGRNKTNVIFEQIWNIENPNEPTLKLLVKNLLGEEKVIRTLKIQSLEAAEVIKSIEKQNKIITLDKDPVTLEPNNFLSLQDHAKMLVLKSENKNDINLRTGVELENTITLDNNYNESFEFLYDLKTLKNLKNQKFKNLEKFNQFGLLYLITKPSYVMFETLRKNFDPIAALLIMIFIFMFLLIPFLIPISHAVLRQKEANKSIIKIRKSNLATPAQDQAISQIEQAISPADKAINAIAPIIPFLVAQILNTVSLVALYFNSIDPIHQPAAALLEYRFIRLTALSFPIVWAVSLFTYLTQGTVQLAMPLIFALLYTRLSSLSILAMIICYVILSFIIFMAEKKNER